MDSNLIEQVYRRHRGRVVVRGGEHYFGPKDALDFVRDANLSDLAIIGLEVFLVEGDYLVPQMDLIADYSSPTGQSWQEYRQQCNQAAVAFIGKLDDGKPYLVNLTIIAEDEQPLMA